VSVKDRGWRFEIEASAGPIVETSFGFADLNMGDGAEVGPLGKVLTYETVGVFVGAALIGAPRIGEV
jgi:hypothetical protein